LEDNKLTLEIILSNESVDVCYYDKNSNTNKFDCVIYENDVLISNNTKKGINDVVFVIPVEAKFNNVYNINITIEYENKIYNEEYVFIYNNTIKTWRK